jgi:hypothetical protein
MGNTQMVMAVSVVHPNHDGEVFLPYSAARHPKHPSEAPGAPHRCGRAVPASPDSPAAVLGWDAEKRSRSTYIAPRRRVVPWMPIRKTGEVVVTSTRSSAQHQGRPHRTSFEIRWSMRPVNRTRDERRSETRPTRRAQAPVRWASVSGWGKRERLTQRTHLTAAVEEHVVWYARLTFELGQIWERGPIRVFFLFSFFSIFFSISNWKYLNQIQFLVLNFRFQTSIKIPI